MTRLQKKALKKEAQLDEAMTWMSEYRGALLEALDENIDLRILDRQFKRRVAKCPFLTVTRMTQYRTIALDL